MNVMNSHAMMVWSATWVAFIPHLELSSSTASVVEVRPMVGALFCVLHHKMDPGRNWDDI